MKTLNRAFAKDLQRKILRAVLCTQYTQERKETKVSFDPKLATLTFEAVTNKTEATLIEEITTNYDLLTESSPEIFFCKLIKSHRLLVLINC